ncbi:hypothetical protein M2364_001944 [Acinetobacter johnsonii]|nr:hypothetical protein [Acinetobacter johnsonii]
MSACQSVEKNTKLIAGTFNTATSIQMKMLDRFAPPDVIVHNNIPYQASPELNVDIYQPQNIEQLNSAHGGLDSWRRVGFGVKRACARLF